LEEHKTVLMAFFKAHKPENAKPEKVAKFLAQFKGKEAELYANLEKKYETPVPGANELSNTLDAEAAPKSPGVVPQRIARRGQDAANVGRGAKEGQAAGSKTAREGNTDAAGEKRGTAGPERRVAAGRKPVGERGRGNSQESNGSERGSSRSIGRSPKLGAADAPAKVPRIKVGGLGPAAVADKTQREKTPRGGRLPRGEVKAKEGRDTVTPRTRGGDGKDSKDTSTPRARPASGGSGAAPRGGDAKEGKSTTTPRIRAAGGERRGSVGTTRTKPGGAEVKVAAADSSKARIKVRDDSADSISREVYHAALIVFFTKHNPEKVDSVDKFLDFYKAKGGWPAMCTKLEEKYGEAVLVAAKEKQTEGGSGTKPALGCGPPQGIHSNSTKAAAPGAVSEHAVPAAPPPATKKMSKLAEMKAKVAAAEAALKS